MWGVIERDHPLIARCQFLLGMDVGAGCAPLICACPGLGAEPCDPAFADYRVLVVTHAKPPEAGAALPGLLGVFVTIGERKWQPVGL